MKEKLCRGPQKTFKGGNWPAGRQFVMPVIRQGSVFNYVSTTVSDLQKQSLSFQGGNRYLFKI